MPRIIDSFFDAGFATSREAAIVPLREWLPGCPKAKLRAVRKWLDSEFSEATVRSILLRKREIDRMRRNGQPFAPGRTQHRAADPDLPGDGLRADRLEQALLHLVSQNRAGDIHQILGPNVPKHEWEVNALRAAVVCAAVVDPDAGKWLGGVTPLARAPWQGDANAKPWVKGRADVVRLWRDEALRLLHQACSLLGCPPTGPVIGEVAAALRSTSTPGPAVESKPAKADDLLNHVRAGELAGVSDKCIRDWLNDGKLTPHGPTRKVSKAELLERLPTIRERQPRLKKRQGKSRT